MAVCPVVDTVFPEVHGTLPEARQELLADRLGAGPALPLVPKPEAFLPTVLPREELGLWYQQAPSPG